MTMHMVHPGLTTLNTRKTKKKPSVKQQQVTAKHDAWLRAQGVHPEQLAMRKDSKPNKLQLNLSVDRSGPQCNNGFAPAGAKNSVFDSQWKKTYDDDPSMAAREETALKKAEAKTKRIAPAYSKGAYQYITSTDSLQDIGKKK